MAFNVCSNRYANWHMDEGSGTNVPDNSGNNRTGTTVNNPSWVTGKLSNCLQFVSASSQYVDCGNIASFERTQVCSYECWFKTSGGTQILLQKYDGTAVRGMLIEFQATGAILFALLTSGANYLHAETIATGFNDGNWHHIVVTYNGTSLVSGVAIYIDSVSKGLSNMKDNLNGTVINANSFCVAKAGNLGYFTGYVDEVVIYDRVLILSEVQGRYNAGAGTESCRIPSSNALLGHDF